MKRLNHLLRFAIALAAASFTLSAHALDQMAKEETTPPSAENALTAEQIPPIDNKAEPADSNKGKS